MARRLGWPKGCGMKMGLTGVLCALALSSAAAASGYSDLNAGIAAHNVGNADDALKFLNSALAAPDLPAYLRPVAYLDRGEAHARKKEYDSALADFSQSLALAPSYAAYEDRAIVYLKKRQFDLARADYTSAMAMRPELTNAYIGHGLVNVSERKFDDAIKDYDKAISTTIDTLELYVLRGDAYRYSGRYDDAIRDYGTAIRRNARLLSALVARGRAYQEQGSYNDALADYKDALAIAPKNGSIHELKGIAEWELGDKAGAADDFSQASGTPEQSNYAFMWSAFAKEKQSAAELDAASASLDLKAWPGPIVKFMLGRSKQADVFSATSDADADVQAAKLCDADFYIGEWQALKGNAREAKRLLGDAALACRSEWPETRAAKMELARLGPT
jgi:tetratricopeptide (TPR) repeat protein